MLYRVVSNIVYINKFRNNTNRNIVGRIYGNFVVVGEYGIVGVGGGERIGHSSILFNDLDGIKIKFAPPNTRVNEFMSPASGCGGRMRGGGGAFSNLFPRIRNNLTAPVQQYITSAITVKPYNIMYCVFGIYPCPPQYHPPPPSP